jgi:mRNA interferase MazF
MPRTIGYEFGDVVLVPFPFTDQTGAKQRPAVVISSALYHRERRDIVIMAVTSQVGRPPTAGDIAVTARRQAGLLKASLVKPIIATVEKQLVRRKLGRLTEEDRRALQGALRNILGA